MNSHNTLSAASDERKARLAKLKGLKRKLPADDDDHGDDDDDRRQIDREPPLPAPSSAEPDPDAGLDLDLDPEPSAAAAPSPPPSKQQHHHQPQQQLHLSGRNYDPETRGPKLGFEAPPTLALDGPTLEQQAADAEARVRQQAAEEAQDDKGIDLFKLQPKKPNWDLKRNLDKRMELLNVRTDNAIARLVRERILGAQQAAKQKGEGRLEGQAALGNGHRRGQGRGVDVDGDGDGRKDRDRNGEEEQEQDGDGNGDGEGAGVDGLALVEGLRVREREEEEEERREREEEEADAMGS